MVTPRNIKASATGNPEFEIGRMKFILMVENPDLAPRYYRLYQKAYQAIKGKGLGRKRSPLTCSRISRARIRHWDSMSVSQKQLKVTQLHKGLLRIGKSVRSSIEMVEAMLVNLGASFEAQSQIDFYLVDFQVGQKVIEVQGDYWHANPIKYPDPNLWDRTQKMCVKRDKAKRTLLQRRGYQILALWETDIKKHPEMCSLQLKEFLACPPTL